MDAWRVKFPIVDNNNLTEKLGFERISFRFRAAGGAKFSERISKKLKTLLLNE